MTIYSCIVISVLVIAVCVPVAPQNLETESVQFRGFSGRFDSKQRPKPPFVLGRTLPVTADSDHSHCLSKVSCKPFFQQKFPTIDGTCNNRVRPRRGSADQTFRRLLQPDYNGIDGPRLTTNGQNLASARAISNAIQEPLQESPKRSQMLPFFGQFLAHDLTLTLTPEEETNNCSCFRNSPECLNIPIPRTDIQFSPRRTCFQFERSTWAANSEDCSLKSREQVNELTAYIDMNTIYGTTEAQVNSLRDRSYSRPGEIVTRLAAFPPAGRLLPLMGDSPQLVPAGNEIFCPRRLIRPQGFPCFISGEPRTNENSVLTSHHNIWTRLHNNIAQGLRKLNPKWNSDRIFETARGIVIGIFQRVTYKHFLPEIIGPTHMKMYGLDLLSNGFYYGYDSTANAEIINSFATAAFRMGHPLININFIRPNPTYTRQQGPTIRVKDALNNPGVVAGNTSGTERAGGPNSFIRGLAAEPSLKFDTRFSDDLRNFLDAEVGKFGSDLLARNIQRGRDHGITSYVNFREFCGLFVPKSFNDLRFIMESVNINNLKTQYRNVEDIDLFPGGVAERPLEDGTIGPTFACIIGYQFRALRNGDRFWHENPPPFGMFNKEQLSAIRRYSFPRILCDVVNDMLTIQPQPLRNVGPKNRRAACTTFPSLDLSPWQEHRASKEDDYTEQDTVWSMWFPLTRTRYVQNFFAPRYETERLSVSQLLDWLLVNRPDQVCTQVLGTEERNAKTDRHQVRFQCLPGTIKFSDFPPVPSNRYEWTNWFKSDFTNGEQCPRPAAIQVQTRPSRGGVLPASMTGQVFSEFSARDGFACEDSQQSIKRCLPYYVRYLCRIPEVSYTYV